MSEFWGLDIFEAMRWIALDEWEPQLTLYRKQPAKGSKPKWHDLCRNVYLLPSDRDNAWLVSTDGRCMVAMEVMGRCDEMLVIPKNALPSQGKRADSSGWRFMREGDMVKAIRISRGYTGQTKEGECVEFVEPCTTSWPQGWSKAIEDACNVPKDATAHISTQANTISRAFAALGTRYDHSFYWPIKIGADRISRDVIAWSDNSAFRAVARMQARVSHD